MSTQIEMPDLSSEGEGATLATWLVSIGDRVEKGDVIAELETDKATVELEAPASGTIVSFAVDEGVEGIMPGAVLANLDPDDAQIPGEGAAADGDGPDESDRSAAAAQNPSAPTPAVAFEPSPAANIGRPEDVPRSATPLARRAALDRDVDLSTVAGSGPGGRVVEEDVLRSVGTDPVASPPRESESTDSGATSLDASTNPARGFEAVRLSAMRKTIARRMSEAKQQIPHFYLRVQCAMDGVIDARAKLNDELAGAGSAIKISVNDFIIRAAALALRDVPLANVSFAGNEMHHFDHVDISVAVATDGGLVTPVVRDADRKGLSALANEIRALAVQARAGKLRPEQYQGGTITISNLGMYGIDTVYPILNPPQACILGVGAAQEQPVVRNGEIVIGQIAAITLAADHRAVDGAVGAQLLAALRERLEDPLCMML